MTLRSTTAGEAEIEVAARQLTVVFGHDFGHCRFPFRRHSRHAGKVHVGIDEPGHEILPRGRDDGDAGTRGIWGSIPTEAILPARTMTCACRSGADAQEKSA